MGKDMNAYMTPGVVSFKAYPEVMTGRSGTIFDGVLRLSQDDFFQAIEVGWMKDWNERDRVSKLLRTTGMDIAYATQPRTIREGLNLNAFDEEHRQGSVEAIKEEIDKAAHLNASRLRLLAGKDPGVEHREDAKRQLIESIDEICQYADKRADITVTLKIFDRDIEKKSLIGTFDDTKDVADAIVQDHDNFGILVDLSHFPLLGTEPEESIPKVEEHLTDFHIGTCVLERDHPAYGDKQPRFSIEHSENDVEDVTDFFSFLLDRGLLNPADRPMVSVEVAPFMAEDRPEVVVANAKRVWKQAWAMATTEQVD
jgi:sugar phosphate isomerase/epimerase